jgi:uncharacterized protein (DUF433 family)
VTPRAPGTASTRGETIEELARDYDISSAPIESAILFEEAA